jgi:hypothetical protein
MVVEAHHRRFFKMTGTIRVPEQDQLCAANYVQLGQTDPCLWVNFFAGSPPSATLAHN